MRKKLGEILLANRLITQQQLDEALIVQKSTSQPLGTVMVSLGFVNETLLLQVLAAQQGVSAWHLDREPPTPDALAKVSVAVCKQYQLLPVQVRNDLLLVAMRNPSDLDAIDFVRNLTLMRVEPVLAEEHKLSSLIERIEQEGLDALSITNKVEEAMSLVAAADLEDDHKSVELADADTRPVVALVNQMISDAIRMGASDMHVEPRQDQVELRFRIDGELVKLRDIPVELRQMLVTRIKIMADLDIVESRLPQNGRIGVKIDGRQVDLRVSTMPNIHGERVVLRILDKTKALKKLDELGFDESNLNLYRNLVTKPYGIFLVTGPTGSGKTTSLYAALQEIKSVKNNIMTCEDPVEYDIPGLNQSQINEKTGLTFDIQLRAILRQDPDVVLVGEIRDTETAQVAMRAAMTGHLVLSTLHTNDAPSAIPRLRDMGIDPFLISNSLIGVMSQRLIRKLCPNCTEEYEATDFEYDLLRAHVPIMNRPILKRAVGCTQCFSSGYKGRMGTHEILPIEGELRDQIAEGAGLQRLREGATAIGYRTIQEDCLTRVIAGQTSIQEAMRVIYFETLAVSTREFNEHLRIA